MSIIARDFPLMLQKVVERANSQTHPFESLKEKYGINEKNGYKYKIIYKNKDEMSRANLKWCFKLIEANVSHYYRASQLGWTPKIKQSDLNKNWSRFLIAKDFYSEENLGFSHFRFDEDNCRAALYCYELHVSEQHRGKGIGSHLMQCMEAIARSLNLECVVLTVLVNNEGAMKFYEKLGFLYDESNKKGEKSFKILSKIISKHVSPSSLSKNNKKT